VLHQQNRHIGFQAADQFGQFHRPAGSHAGIGFVQEQHLGMAGQRHAHLELALFAVGQVGGREVGAIFQSHAGQRRFNGPQDGRVMGGFAPEAKLCPLWA
jgi:hypothetical protein